MSQVIPPPSSRRPTLGDSPTLQTPNGSPPSAPSAPASFEGRLNELLAHFDSGTHEFCRQERETPEEKALGWGGEQRNPLLRKPSLNFLSSLSLSRPLPPSAPASSSTTPAVTPTYGAFPKGFPGLSMTTTANTGSSPPFGGLNRATTVPRFSPKAPTMERAASSPTSPHAAAGLLPLREEASVAPPLPANSAPKESKRRFSQHHFDPSREPKLLGLL